MEILCYNDLDFTKVEKNFRKVTGFLNNNDFVAADIKKMPELGFYRAKLDYENRLLFKFAKYDGKTFILLLEVIYNHDYNKSRFLRGAKIDENKLLPLHTEKIIHEDDFVKMNYVNPTIKHFHLLDKIISLDSSQIEIFNLPTPVIIIGSAGSGKTVLTLEKIKTLTGKILYVTLSPFLVENSSTLYYSNNYINEEQELEFLSFREFLDSLQIVKGKEADYRIFESWISSRIHSFGLKEPYKLFEEFKGVLTGLDITKPYMSKEDYCSLGIKQSIFLSEEREKVYDAFRKYLEFLNESGFYDLNIATYNWLPLCKPEYDFIVIDEVQDFTNIQLYIILKSLKNRNNFILCGDSNQIVHPNFFSWSHIKTMFYEHDLTGSVIKILRTNYRNSITVTEIANRLLKIKNARFGSIDKESTFLVNSISTINGEVIFYKDTNNIRQQLNEKTKKSARFAILVMRNDEKNEIRKIFKTPLLFSIQEAKGLEYDNIILINFISNNFREFHEICESITNKDLVDENFIFARVRDKSDKSLDAYKFYINAFYVAITRSIKNLYILETSPRHEILQLLNLVESKEKVEIKEDVSSLEDWKNEARKLELQGKAEQAEEIRKTILGIRKPDWEPLTPQNIGKLKEEALNPNNFNKKAKDKLFDYALIYNELDVIEQLCQQNYRRAERYTEERSSLFRKYYQYYKVDDVKTIDREIQKYGIDYRDHFNLTPLLAAVQAGSAKIIQYLLKNGANPGLTDNYSRNALQIALFQSKHIPGYTETKLGIIYPLVLTENIKIQVENRLIKIDKQKIEYFLLNFFISLQSSIINEEKRFDYKAICANDLLSIVDNYPETILPEYRKGRSYLLANLAKNEVESNNIYNKKLFIRMHRDKEMVELARKYGTVDGKRNIWLKDEEMTDEEIEKYYLKDKKDKNNQDIDKESEDNMKTVIQTKLPF
ncbi:MAG: UvrD-helicase domain-containing protein [Bacteroidia bacterium]|nr:UvrD-helicase domain-containing protein [Bacteroidia bacterium]